MKNIAFTKRIFAAILAVSLLGCSAVSVSAYESVIDEPIPAAEPVEDPIPDEPMPWNEPDIGSPIPSNEPDPVPAANPIQIDIDGFYCLKYEDYVAIVGYTGSSKNVSIPIVV